MWNIKKIAGLFLIMGSASIRFSHAESLPALVIFVAANGSDTNNGASISAPVATFAKVQEIIKSQYSQTAGAIRVRLIPGGLFRENILWSLNKILVGKTFVPITRDIEISASNDDVIDYREHVRANIYSRKNHGNFNWSGPVFQGPSSGGTLTGGQMVNGVLMAKVGSLKPSTWFTLDRSRANDQDNWVTHLKIKNVMVTNYDIVLDLQGGGGNTPLHSNSGTRLENSIFYNVGSANTATPCAINIDEPTLLGHPNYVAIGTGIFQIRNSKQNNILTSLVENAQVRDCHNRRNWHIFYISDRSEQNILNGITFLNSNAIGQPIKIRNASNETWLRALYFNALNELDTSSGRPMDAAIAIGFDPAKLECPSLNTNIESASIQIPAGGNLVRDVENELAPLPEANCEGL